MKAFLLAAGRGTRLGTITEKTPKCLVPIQGKPLLHYWLRLCRHYGITDVLINVHHLADRVLNYLACNNYGIDIIPFYENTLMGTAGTVAANRWFVAGEDQFFILYADNLTNVNLQKFLDFHKRHCAIFTMGLFRSSSPEQCGVVSLDERNLIVKFCEKPSKPETNMANAGIYLSGQELFDRIPERARTDFGYDVLPTLVNRMHGYVIDEYLIDIGTLQNYRRAQREWQG
jgi:mannose-1-phosphate guanylyltransferase